MGKSNALSEYFLFFLLSIIGLALFCGLFWIYPNYNVWAKTMHGQAQLKEAEFSRQIVLVEAEAKKNAALALGEAEVIRATKLAEANEILGKSLAGNDEYLKYLWITEVAANEKQGGNTQVIYLPSSELMPFTTALEAGRVDK